jgi:hypothetical protein
MRRPVVHRHDLRSSGDSEDALRAGRRALSIVSIVNFLKLTKFANFCKFLAGSFSAVSKRIFARKYAFDSIFQALQDLHTFAPLQSQYFRKK